MVIYSTSYHIMFKRDPAKLDPHDALMRAAVLPLIPSWVSPNAVTILRLCLIPVVWLFLSRGEFAVAVPLFLFAAFTDILDGSLARVRNHITAWGTFYDPFADKLLIGVVLLYLILRRLNIWIGGSIVFVELMILLGGFIRRNYGMLTSANVLGKIKMHCQVYGVVLYLIGLWITSPVCEMIAVWILLISLLLAVISLLTYGI